MGFFSSLFGGKKQGFKKRKVKVPIIDLAKRFELRARTGQGSMSKCWHAYDNNLGRMVCLKLLDKLKTAKFEDRFTNQGLDKPSEGEVCMALKHPNCVSTYEHGRTTKGEPYLVMGGSRARAELPDRDRSPQPKGNRVNYLKPLRRRRLPALHQVPAPRPVPAERDGDQRAGQVDRLRADDPIHADYCRPGTGQDADYLAPEIIKRQSTDHRVDIFALGVGVRIFTGQLRERSLSVRRRSRHLNTPPRDPKDLNPDLDDGARGLRRAISRPDRRFPASVLKERSRAWGDIH